MGGGVIKSRGGEGAMQALVTPLSVKQSRVRCGAEQPPNTECAPTELISKSATSLKFNNK